MSPNANLLFYINLAGEAFYIITHRMKSQKVKVELQQKVYNDLAACICHSGVLQNLRKGALQILEMNISDIRVLLERIVHSSIMTVNSYSMEKLFELTLIATRYQYTVCQHPNDILLIALNHLDGIRNSVTDTTAVHLCADMHKCVVEDLRWESSMTMQGYRFSILTYLADVKLKMTNLIKLGYQKPTGEFVKRLSDSNPRREYRKPGTIELFRPSDLADSSVTSNEGIEPDSFRLEEEEDKMKETNWMYNEFFNDERLYSCDNCHFENISFQMHDHELQDDAELLEIEYVENSFHEVIEPPESAPKIVVKFGHVDSNLESSGVESEKVIAKESAHLFEMYGSRGISLGQSIYDIPGNSDEDRDKTLDGEPNDQKNEPDELSHLDDISVKAVQGLQLCSIMLGCRSSTDKEPSAPTNFPSFAKEGENPNNGDLIPTSPTVINNQAESSENLRSGSGLTGVNVVQFDARSSKSKLDKLYQDLDMGSSETTNSPEADKHSLDLFNLIEDSSEN